KRLDLADRLLGGERLEPGELDADTGADEALLAEVLSQRIGSPGVPAVEWRQRGERRGHGPLLYGDANFASQRRARGERLPPLREDPRAAAGVPRGEQRPAADRRP